MALEVTRRLFTVDEYYQMAATGILHEDDRVELIAGEILQMAAIGSHHAGAIATCSATHAACAFPSWPFLTSVSWLRISSASTFPRQKTTRLDHQTRASHSAKHAARQRQP
jgi:hypothetical protein